MGQGPTRRLVTRRRVRRAVVCLILGSAITVAVAWGSALATLKEIPSPRHVIGTGELGEYGWTFDISDTGDSGIGIKGAFEEGGEIIETRMIPKHSIQYYQFGVPFRSMTAESGGGMSGWGLIGPFPFHMDYRAVDAALEMPGWLPDSLQGRRLPLRPMWPGFLYSTLVYGGVAWFALFAPGVIRVHRRRRRGLCLHCGYDLAGITNTVCPECGKPTEREA